jgi:hypothetical protein
MSTASLPTDVANQALDAIGWPAQLGDITDGSDPARILLRAYSQDRRQLLRCAHWGFARKEAPMQLLGDRTGQTPNVGTLVPSGWTYVYAYPTDCLKVRFVPWNWETTPLVPSGNIQIPTTPQTTGEQQPWIGPYLRPAKFVEAMDVNYPPPPGQDLDGVQGVSIQGRTVILTNVKDAKAVYTADMMYPNVWDVLFRAAMVAYLASEVALPIWAKTDRKFGLTVRNEQIEIVKAKVLQARMTDSSEGVPTSDIAVDWIRGRNVGGRAAWTGGHGGGDWDNYCGYDSLMLANGAVF